MLWGVVDTLVGSAEAVTEKKEREKKHQTAVPGPELGIVIAGWRGLKEPQFR